MKSFLALTVILFLSTVVESTILPFPFVLILSILFFVVFQDIKTISTIFLISLILDALSVLPLGFTSLFLFSFLSLLSLYARFFELKDYKMIIILVFPLSLFYAHIAAYSVNVLIFGLLYGSIALVSLRILGKKAPILTLY